MTQPTYLSQGISYLGFLSKQLGELRGKTTLAHELIQNADDAKDASGKLSATRITFDFKDDALVVSNDAVLRETDFERMRDVAGASKRSEFGDRTTGAFGVGFISVYQVTDRPEIHSSGWRWTIRPEYEEGKRIRQDLDPSLTRDKGTVFRLPWAFEESPVRERLKVTPVDQEYIESFIEELKDSAPKSILFLKKLEVVELCQNGKLVSRVTRDVEGSDILVDRDGIIRYWQVFEGDFHDNALELKAQNPTIIEDNRSAHVRVAIPDSSIDDGLLFATLPTEQSIGLPFHIDADFFPASDRKSIPFDDSYDPKSEWNRAAIRAAASGVRDNLIPLRDMFQRDAPLFWAILSRLNLIHREHKHDERMPLGAFWESLEPSLGEAPIVYSESRQWLKPIETRIPTGDEEGGAVSTFEALGIEIVHRDLWKYRNILTSNGVGRLSVKDIYEALKRRGLIERPQQVPSDFQTHELLKPLWQGIHGVLENTQGQSAREEAEGLLRKCALAPALDGRLWPSGSVYQADEHTSKIFANLILDDVSFLAVERIPLLKKLCPQFTVNEAIKELERQDSQKLQSRWNSGNFRPQELLHWFDDNKSKKLTGGLRERLALLPIFPSAGKLRSLKSLHLPGGFGDPIGVAVLVDMGQLEGLSDFLGSLGAKELTFEDYATRYISEAFDGGSTTSLKAKRKLLDILATRIGEIKKNAGLKTKLSNTNIVECADGRFRQPINVYFQCKEVRAVLGDLVSYVHSSEESEDRDDLYRWLGVQDHPRPEDVLQRIDELAAKPPDVHIRETMVEIFKALGKLWTNLSDGNKELFWPLKDKAWLPADDDQTKWYKPDQLHAIYNKSLFASQAKFLDAPVGTQRQTRDFLGYLKVNLSPQPYHVVRHLLKCSRENKDPPKDVYRWLDNNANPQDLYKLRDSACLRVQDKYLRPKQVYWGPHHFGRFRTQLGSNFRSFQALLSALCIRDAPNYIDAIEVLKDISEEVGNRKLESNEKDVVFHCWAMLAEALQNEKVDAREIESSLKHTCCVPNPQDKLYPPSWMVIEDRPGLAARFPKELENNSIRRLERLWPAIRAAGVRPISTVVVGSIDEPIDAPEDEMLKDRIAQRKALIKTLLEGMRSHDQSNADAIQFDSIRFFRTDELKVKWYLKDFLPHKSPPRSPEPVSAHLNRKDRSIYFTCPNGNTEWSAIARELTLAIAPGEEIKSLSPGLKIVLEAHSHDEAVEQLNDLGIAVTEELSYEASAGSVAESFKEAPPSTQPEDSPTPSQDVPSIGSLPDRSQQMEQNEPAGSDVTSEGGEEDAPRPSGSTRPAFRNGKGGTHTYGETSPDEMAPEIQTPTSGPTPAEADGRVEPFARMFFEAQTINRPTRASNPLWLPEGGPTTKESAEEHTRQSTKSGRAGAYIGKTVTRWEPAEAASELAERFRTLVESDYAKRCQICTKTFTKPNGKFQLFVVHFIPPSADNRTNHFGNLLGLCGWHYALLKYGEFAFLDPRTNEPFDDWRRWRDSVLGAAKERDESGNGYISGPLRFWNVYQEWRTDPETIDEEIRFSIPHWMYLCELLKT